MKIDSLLRHSRDAYASLVTNSKSMVTTAGRYAADAGKVRWIWPDICQKLDLQNATSLFDIGCGYGSVTQQCLRYAKKRNLSITLMDIPEIIASVRQDLLPTNQRSTVKFIEGLFPNHCPASFLKKVQFDRVLLYSVIHYTTQPRRLIDAAVRLLRPGGRLLIGDIPNLNKKGRFLASPFGHRFEARYRNSKLSDIARYRSHQDFVNRNRTPQNAPFSDALVLSVSRRYRKEGFDVFVLPQPDNLPFCYTREDLLICRPKD